MIPKNENDLIVVDLEMTGLQVKTDRILEIGAVRIHEDQITDSFQTFVNPHRRLEERIIELTGITDDMVADALEADAALEAFLAFAGDCPLLGHNIRFDYGFLKQCAINNGRKFERKALDTLKIARKVLKEPEKKSLDVRLFFHCAGSCTSGSGRCAGNSRTVSAFESAISGEGTGSVLPQRGSSSYKEAGTTDTGTKKRLESFDDLS